MTLPFNSSWLGMEPGQLPTWQIKACLAWLDRVKFRRRLTEKQAKRARKAAKQGKPKQGGRPWRSGLEQYEPARALKFAKGGPLAHRAAQVIPGRPFCCLCSPPARSTLQRTARDARTRRFTLAPHPEIAAYGPPSQE